jgi:hypothetical protein
VSGFDDRFEDLDRLVTELNLLEPADGVARASPYSRATADADFTRLDSQHVRKNALQHLNQEITITRRAGSFSLEESLARLVKQGVLDRTDAQLRAAHPEELESLIRM